MIESDIHERSNKLASLAAHGVFRAPGGKVTKRVTNFLVDSPVRDLRSARRVAPMDR